MLAKSVIKKYFPYYKWGVYFLMLVNTGLFFFFVGNSDAGVENIFWIILLLLFEWETSQIDKPYVNRYEKYFIRALTAVCYLVIVLSAIHYSGASYQSEWGSLDAWTAWTWLMVIAVIEYDIYAPGLYSRPEWFIRNGLKFLLYSALIVYIVIWIAMQRWVDAWDAFLWLLCFFSIEMNIFAHEDELPYAEDQNQQPSEVAGKDRP